MSYRARQRARRKARPQDRVSTEPARSTAESVDIAYPVTLTQEHEGDTPDWIATVDALPGCTVRAPTAEDALAGVPDAVAQWVDEAARNGRSVPEPKSSQSHSGRLLLRMPQTLHAELARLAERERVSLNQFITDVLAGALGWRVPPRVRTIAAETLSSLNGGDPSTAAEPEPQRRASRLIVAAVLMNVLVVAAAAVVAIVVLVTAWL